mmetsp:Transcript_9512/g.28617  ORF Transcript_9512/g.28617 Transcript_9512/m.28617 type:complete len:207 (-) Transcript_9512:2580-3200(-)
MGSVARVQAAGAAGAAGAPPGPGHQGGHQRGLPVPQLRRRLHQTGAVRAAASGHRSHGGAAVCAGGLDGARAPLGQPHELGQRVEQSGLRAPAWHHLPLHRTQGFQDDQGGLGAEPSGRGGGQLGSPLGALGGCEGDGSEPGLRLPHRQSLRCSGGGVGFVRQPRGRPVGRLVEARHRRPHGEEHTVGSPVLPGRAGGAAEAVTHE